MYTENSWKMLYYDQAIDLTLLSALSTLGTAQSKGGTAVMKATDHLLDYCSTHTDAIVRFWDSDMILNGHSDASYLCEAEARSREGGYHFYGI